MPDYKREDLIVVNALLVSISLVLLIVLLAKDPSTTYCFGVFWKID